MTSIVATVADLHGGSTVAVCPPRFTLDDGGTYSANKIQAGFLWPNWLEYWQLVKTRRGSKKKNKLYLVFDGDLLENCHHNTSQVITQNITAQKKLVLEILKPALDLEPDYIFVVRGTEAHGGEAGRDEEAIAADIGAVVDPDTGASSWWWLPLEVEGVLFDIAHKATIGGRPSTQLNSPSALAVDTIIWYNEQERKPPDVILRAHTHHKVDTGDNYKTRVLYLPSWQIKTSYAYGKSPVRVLPVGGYIFTCDNKVYIPDKFIRFPEMHATWRTPND